MTRTARVVGSAVLTVVLAAGAYLTADAYDAVPGFVTLAPLPPPPPPFPTAPGAILPTSVPPVLSDLSATAPVPDGDAVSALVSHAVSDKRTGASVGAIVIDQATGAVISQVDASGPRTPASTAKLLTATAALGVLGSESHFTTSVVRGSTGAEIVLVGGGDLLLAAGPGDPTATNGRAGLADLAADTARALRLSGNTTVRVRLDDRLFTGPAVSPTWQAAYLTNGFVAPVASLEVNIGKLRNEEYPPRQTDPALSAARVFADALAAQGIAIDGAVARAAAAQGAATIASVDSATVHEVVTYALQTSDNTVTEALGRMVAVKSGFAASFDGATKAVLAHLTAVGLDTSSAQLADCSGLGDGSHLSARLLADILLLATNPAHPEYLPVALDLPVAGMSGTLVDRFTTSGARGVVRAKTGSLPNVTSLAGTILDADGRLLVFAMIADQTPPGGQTGPRVVIDGLVDGLAGCGCLAPSG